MSSEPDILPLGYTLQVDEQGRVVIPKEFLRLLDVTDQNRSLYIYQSIDTPGRIILTKTTDKY